MFIDIALLYNNAKIAGKLADAYAKSRREILRDTPRNVSTIKASSADDATPLSAPSRTPNVVNFSFLSFIIFMIDAK